MHLPRRVAEGRGVDGRAGDEIGIASALVDLLIGGDVAQLAVERRQGTLIICGQPHPHRQADVKRIDVTRRHMHLDDHRSEEHTSELQSLMRISYAVFCLKKKTITRLKIMT